MLVTIFLLSCCINVSNIKTAQPEDVHSSPFPVVNILYNNVLCTKLEGFGLLKVSDTQDVQECIDVYISAIVNVMYSPAKESGCIPKNQYTPKRYWCPELSNLPDY